MVELGDQEAELNETFGRQAAAVCDHVILVGPQRTAPIDAGPAGGRLLRRRRSPWSATSPRRRPCSARLTRAGDVVLFENDLPDMYAEPDRPRRAAAVPGGAA